MSYVIEDGIPMRSKARNLDMLRATINALQVEQSFLMEAHPSSASCAYQAAKRANMRISIRKQSKGVVRVWRVE